MFAERYGISDKVHCARQADDLNIYLEMLQETAINSLHTNN